MTAKMLDGKALAARIKETLSNRIKKLEEQGINPPGLAVILVGDDPASRIYVGHKQRACKAVGIRSHTHELPEETDQDTLITLIDDCNRNPDIQGILLQLPLPAHLSSTELLERIHPDKDIDGFHPYNLGRLAQRHPRLRPCTPYGVIQLLESSGERLAGKHAVVVGASNIVGRPMMLELLLKKCTVTICHRFTQDLEAEVKRADVLVVAVGSTQVVQSEWIKPGAMVVDIGMNRHDDGRLTGDLDFDIAKERAGWITPVPGGVGPMTVATLLENTLQAADYQLAR